MIAFDLGRQLGLRGKNKPKNQIKSNQEISRLVNKIMISSCYVIMGTLKL